MEPTLIKIMAETTASKSLADHLAEANYAFVCPSPETQGRVVHQRTSDASTACAKNAQDFFGWNLPCNRQTLNSIIPSTIIDSLDEAHLINKDDNEQYRSAIRVSNLYLPSITCTQAVTSQLYHIHSSSSASSDSGFFGPDAYIFMPFLDTVAHRLTQSPQSIIDVCCGSGAVAIHLAREFSKARVLGLDLDTWALRLGRINAHLAGLTVTFLESIMLTAVPIEMRVSGVDLIIIDPPYIAASEISENLPITVDGGFGHGLDISIRFIEEGLKILSSDGLIVVYTGVAMPTAYPGHDTFLEELKGVNDVELLEYKILHPDMWPERIGLGAYTDVCRIQVVGAVLRKKAQ